jgi:small subunit ribosomal protein S13
MAERKETRTQELIRISGKDLPGRKPILVGLTKIKGISWSFSNALCRLVGLNPNKRTGELEESEIKKIEDFMKNPEIPGFLKNRRNDFDKGGDFHLSGSDLKLKNEFDVKRLKKIKSYRGSRHSNKLPVRGQRTKGNFRKNRKKSAAKRAKK